MFDILRSVVTSPSRVLRFGGKPEVAMLDGLCSVGDCGFNLAEVCHPEGDRCLVMHAQLHQDDSSRRRLAKYQLSLIAIEEVRVHDIERMFRLRKVIQVHLFKVGIQLPHRNPYSPQGPGNRHEVSLGGDQALGNFFSTDSVACCP